VVPPEELPTKQLGTIDINEGNPAPKRSNAEEYGLQRGEAVTSTSYPGFSSQASATLDLGNRVPSRSDVLDTAERPQPNDVSSQEHDNSVIQNSLLDQVTEEIGKFHSEIESGVGGESSVTKPPAASVHDQLSFPTDKSKDEIQETDHLISKSPQAAAEILMQAKKQLMARLRSPGPHSESSRPTDPNSNPSGVQGDTCTESNDAPHTGVGNAEAFDHPSLDPELQYPSIGDSERGLLTDIPLVLGPNEIEALPLLIQRGIVPPLNGPVLSPKEEQEQLHMHTVRCNILLAQDAGRNLLRELLIFIVAWEIKDKEFYFRLMTQIMKAILNNGLMPFAYQTFGEVKDIVSPAQAIIIKIVTQLFRLKQYNKPPYGYHVKDGESPLTPKRVDLLIVRYMFTVFRQSIIPETCSLIYLQGQIRQGAAFPEDFPLTLWDMERVYEGVYQFLEFFAVLTESETWKELLIRWEIVSELTTLLRELDQAIPKAPLTPAQQAREVSDASGTTAKLQTAQSPPSVSTPIVERPYDPVGAEDTDSVNALASESPMQDFDNQDPCDFEWKNLKKLVILVLSSLVWKSVPVQEQIREYGGVELVLSCCNYDRYNPYIREHAIMCLRFLLEGNPKNQEIVEKLEARKVVPSEVLDNYGYETFIDKEGKVGLRPKAPVQEEPVVGTTVVEL
jgi:palmitoyltransferase